MQCNQFLQLYGFIVTVLEGKMMERRTTAAVDDPVM